MKISPHLSPARLAPVAFALSLCVATACDGGTESGTSADTGTEMGPDTGTEMGTGGELSHAADIQPIWDANCTNSGCHQPGGIFAELDLSVDAYDNLVGVMSSQALALDFVDAGDAEMSYLVHKLRGTQLDAGGSGNRMPAGAGADPLSETDIATVEAWIDAGAMP